MGLPCYNPLVDYVISRLVLALAWFFQQLPPSWAQVSGHVMGKLAWFLLPSRRRLVRSNLTQAYPDMDSPEMARMIHDIFQRLGALMVEVLRMPLITPHNYRDWITYEGMEYVEAARAKGKGVILLSSHIGNWEVGSIALGLYGLPCYLVTRPMDNPHLEALANRWRTRPGISLIPKHGAALKLARILKEGSASGVMMDQNYRDRKNAVFVDFFGRPAATTPLAAQYHLRFGAALILGHCLPEGRGKFKLTFHPEIEFMPTGNMSQDIQALTQKITACVEDDIRKNPHLWFWLHNRWKTQLKKKVAEPALASSPVPVSKTG